MSLQFQQTVQDDFSGGVTDYFYGGAPNQANAMDNLLIDANKKAYLADGVTYLVNAKVPEFRASYADGNVQGVPPFVTKTRITGIFYSSIFGNATANSGPAATEFGFASNEARLYSLGQTFDTSGNRSSTVTEIKAPSSQSVYSNYFIADTISNSAPTFFPISYACFSEWKGHLLTTNSDYSSPMKIYSSGSGVGQGYVAYQLGLPLPSPPTAARTQGYSTGSSYIYNLVYYYSYSAAVSGANNTFQVYGPTTGSQVKINNIGSIGQTLSSTTATITIAAPGVITFSYSNPLTNGSLVVLTTTGALPTGLSAQTIYYVTAISSTTYFLSTSLANANAGVYITTSGTQSGVHTVQPMSLDTAKATTMTIATPAVVTIAGTSVSTGNTIVFATTGALPTGVTAGLVYFISRITATTFNIATSLANITAGTFVATTGTQSGVQTSQQSTGEAVTLTNIPVLSSGRYPTTALGLKVLVYRTTANGTAGYLVATLSNGTTSYTDTTSDSTLTGSIPNVIVNPNASAAYSLYTNGGVQDRYRPPECKFLHTVNGFTYYANTQENDSIFGTSTFSYYTGRVRQSVQNAPDACVSPAYIDLPEEVTGISSFRDLPLVFTRNHVYRLNGFINELGQGQINYEDITKTIGCISHQSIVQTTVGVFWASHDGFYWTDGSTFSKVSNNINETYKLVYKNSRPRNVSVLFPDNFLYPAPGFGSYLDTSEIKVSGTYDRLNQRIYWAVRLDGSSVDNDAMIVADLKFGNPQNAVFTIRKFAKNIYPSVIGYSPAGTTSVVIGETNGYVLYQSPTIVTDVVVNPSVTTPSLWNTVQIIPSFRSTNMDFGLPNFRKWVPKMSFKMDSTSKSMIQVNSYNENSSTAFPLKEVRSFKSMSFGDAAPIFNVTNTTNWNDTSIIEEMRRFPATQIRATQKQIEITLSSTIIYNSDTYGLVTINGPTVSAGSNRTIVFTNLYSLPMSTGFPIDVVGYSMSFKSDGYVNLYPIISYNSSTGTAVISDPKKTFREASGSTSKWEIKGTPKYQDFKIESVVTHYAPISSQSLKTWRKETDNDGSNS